MEIFTIISGTCSILSLIVALFIANKVNKININNSGKKNTIAGGNIDIKNSHEDYNK